MTTMMLNSPGPMNATMVRIRKNAGKQIIANEGKGEQTRFIHDRYPARACAIALEFKKFYMDEWTGEPIPEEVAAMRRFIRHIAKTAEGLLNR